MLTLVLCAALSQNPKVTVVQSSNLGVAPKRTAELLTRLTELLISERLDAVDAKTACEDRACLLSTGKKLGVGAVISVAFASLGKDVVMDLEAITVADGKSLVQTTFTMKANEMKLPFEAAAWAADVRRALPAPAPPPAVVKQEDTPKETKLTPEPPPPTPPVTVTETSSSKSVVPGIALGAGAVIAGAVAAVLLATAPSETARARLQDPMGSGNSAYTRKEAEAIAGSANARYTGSLAATIGAGALAVAATLYFVF